MAEAIRDGNHVPNMLMESSTTPGLTLNVKGNQVTGRLLVESAAGSGTVTSVSVVTANGFAGTVADATTTPAITLTTTINAPVLAGNGTAISAATTTGSGSTVVLATSPTLVTPILGTPQSVTLTNGTGLPLSTGVTGQLALANGGTGANLADPGADRIFFWDDSAGVVDWLIVGAGLAITDKTIAATGGGVSFGSANQIPYTNATTDDFDYTAGFTFDGTDFAVPGDASIGDDLLLTSSGALININSGNWVATHSSGILTVSTGDLRVTTAGTNAASVVTVGGTQTLTAKTLTAPIIVSGGFIADANGNELIIFTTTASAVNEVTFANAATGNNPKFTASGGDANVGLDFQAKGTGVYRFLGTADQAAELRLYEDTDAGTNFTAFKVGTQAGDITYTLPTDDGDSGQVLSTDGSGVLDWITPSGGTPRINFTEPFEYWSATGNFTNRFRSGAISSGSPTIDITYGGVQILIDANDEGGGLLGSTPGNSTPTEAIFDASPEISGIGQLSSDTSTNFVATYIFGGAFVASGLPNSDGDYTVKHHGFIMDRLVLYASNANGTTQTKTDISSGVTMTNKNTYRSVQSGSTNIKFYVNRTLKATHTTNLPSGALAQSQMWGVYIDNDNGVSTSREMNLMPLSFGWNGE